MVLFVHQLSWNSMISGYFRRMLCPGAPCWPKETQLHEIGPHNIAFFFFGSRQDCVKVYYVTIHLATLDVLGKWVGAYRLGLRRDWK